MKDLKELITVFTKIRNQGEMEKLFSEIFTNAEKKDFSLRWSLMKDLYNGLTQREIAKKRKISLCKITRGSKIVKSNSVTKKYLQKILGVKNE